MARVLIVVQDSVWSKKTISIGSDSMIRLYKACIQSYFDCNGILTVKQRHINYYQDKLDKLQQRYLKNCLPPNKRYNKQDMYVMTRGKPLHNREESHKLTENHVHV